MLKKRIIPTLLINNRKLVKTINFKDEKYIGDPLNAIRIFNEKFVDELIIIDITNKTNPLYKIDFTFLKDLFSECFVPVTYGGGIKSIKDADEIFKIGVEKISLNSKILSNIEIIRDLSNEFGSQSIIVNIDVKRSFLNKIKVYNYKTRSHYNIDLIEYIKEIESLGAGEVIINSVDKDGTMKGMDLDLIEKTNNKINLPIIYSGGIGSIKDIKSAFQFDIAGVSAGSFFCFYGPHKAVLISYPHEELKLI